MHGNLDNLLLYLIVEEQTETDKVIQNALQDWVEKGRKADEGPYWFPPKELFRYREYMRPTREDLLKSIKEEGIKEPIVLLFGKDGTIKIGEGNHRLKAAIQLGLDEVPVTFSFVQSAEKHAVQRDKAKMEKDKERIRKKSEKEEKEALRKKFGLDKMDQKEKERLEREWEQMTPEEKEEAKRESEKRAENIMDILGI